MKQRGLWLGIDTGSSKKKVATLCAIESFGYGEVRVDFEQGPVEPSYPAKNTQDVMLDRRRPRYLRAEVEDAVAKIVEKSVLLQRCRLRVGEMPITVAIDAPVAFAVNEPQRATEAASSESFRTPTRARFERDLSEKKKEGFFRSVVYWKCVGFAMYREVAALLSPKVEDPSLETLASWTVETRGTDRGWTLREIFPSDVYKRANGTVGVLADVPRQVLSRVVEATWQAAEPSTIRSQQTLKRLVSWKEGVAQELKAGDSLPSFAKAGSVFGDLLDAFTGAFAACCESHGGGVLHGGSEIERVQREGAILTVATRAETH